MALISTHLKPPPPDEQSTPTPKCRPPSRSGRDHPFAAERAAAQAQRQCLLASGQYISPHRTPKGHYVKRQRHDTVTETKEDQEGKRREYEVQEYTVLSPVREEGMIEPVPPALFCPIWKVDESMRGRKVRLIGQVLHYNAKKATIVLTGQPDGLCKKCPTLVVNISVPLLALSPSVPPPQTASLKTHYPHQRAFISNLDQPPHPSVALLQKEVDREGLVGREMVSFGRGDWVGVVGWLEDGRDVVRKLKTSGVYASPPPLVCEAIHISNARPPPKSHYPQAPLANRTGIVRTMSEIDTRWQKSAQETVEEGSDERQVERERISLSPPSLSPRTPPEIKREDEFEVRILLPGESANYERYEPDVTPKANLKKARVKVRT
ncbi:hypothetical protein IAR50_002574 [Cryptococcus sp. DSM 104548]